MAEAKDKRAALPLYKGKPLVRSGRTVYYGDPSEDYVAMLQILSVKEGTGDGPAISDRVLVQLLSTNEELSPKDRIIKKAEKKGLYEALNIASIWLDRSVNS